MRGLRVASLSEQAREVSVAWRLLGFEQRVAAAGSVLLIVSTFGPFSFVEAAEVLTAIGVLLLLKRRADGSQCPLPFGDGTAIAAAGAWCGLLILIRLFDRPLGQNLLALACAGLVFAAGVRERAKRPMDALPPETVRVPREPAQPPHDAPTSRIPRDAEVTDRISAPPDRGSASEEPPR